MFECKEFYEEGSRQLDRMQQQCRHNDIHEGERGTLWSYSPTSSKIGQHDIAFELPQGKIVACLK